MSTNDQETGGRSYQDMLAELRQNIPERGGLLQSFHEPGLRERLAEGLRSPRSLFKGLETEDAPCEEPC